MNIKNEQGITMLALVITIVVMVILASIAISNSVGDNGLIKQTEEGTIQASIREVEEALEAYLLLKEKELIKNGDLSTNVGLSYIAETGAETTDEERAAKILTEADNSTETGFNIYTIKDISKLNVKGKYGKGTKADTDTTDVFKIKENTSDNTYEVYYINPKGEVVNK